MPKVPKLYLDARNAEILAAAVQCFARKGLQATHMADIASEAGLSVGSLYRYFPSKEDLFLALCEAALATNEGLWEKAGESGDPLTTLEAFVSNYMDMLSDPACRISLALDSRLRIEALDSEVVSDALNRSYEFELKMIFSLLRKAAGRQANSKKVRARARMLVGLLMDARFQVLINPKVDIRSYKSEVLQVLRNWTTDN